jgi:choice-of-anchor C domain-containing protein
MATFALSSRVRSLGVGAALLSGLSWSCLANAQIVQDGDFSSPYGGSSYTTYGGGSTFGPWNVTGNSIDLTGALWQAPNNTPGTGTVDLDGNDPGGITQNLGTLAAGKYQLTFDLSGNPQGAPTTKALDVSVGGVTQGFTYTLSAANSFSNMLYQTETLDFTLTKPTATTLSFTSLDSSPTFYGPVIGDVAIQAVPEPATYALMLIGMGVMGFASRRKSATYRQVSTTA